MKVEEHSSHYHGGEIAHSLPGPEILSGLDLNSNQLSDHLVITPDRNHVVRWYPETARMSERRRGMGLKVDREGLKELAVEAQTHFRLLEANSNLTVIPHRSYVAESRHTPGGLALWTTAQFEVENSKPLGARHPAGLTAINGVISYLQAAQTKNLPRVLGDLHNHRQHRKSGKIQDTDPIFMENTADTMVWILNQLESWAKGIPMFARGRGATRMRIKKMLTTYHR